jgi:hypothetical protein
MIGMDLENASVNTTAGKEDLEDEAVGVRCEVLRGGKGLEVEG